MKMEKMSNKVKIAIVVTVIVILAGITIIATKGLNFGMQYQEAKKIQLYLQKEFNIEDIKQITNEVLQNQEVIIQKVEVYEDTVSILAKDITDEQKNNVISKVNEKYQTELKAEEVETISVPQTRGRDIVKPYIVPFIITTLIILVYMAIRYYRLRVMKTVLKTGILLVITQMLLLSLIAITRVPITEIIIPLVLTVYVVTLVAQTKYLEKKLEDMKQEQEEIEE